MPAANAYLSGHLVPSPLWNLLVLQLLRPDSSNLPGLYSTFHLEYLLVLSRFRFVLVLYMFDLCLLLYLQDISSTDMSMNRTEPYERVNESDSDDVCLYAAAYFINADSYKLKSTKGMVVL